MFMQKFRNMHKTTLQILLLWLFSASAFALQHCCEAIVEVPYHTHSQVEADSAGRYVDHDHGGATDAHQVDNYKHCRTIRADISDIPLLALTYSWKWDHKTVVPPYRQVAEHKQEKKFFHQDNSIWIVDRRSTYLDTLRLRI